ncbi:MAG: hypothetical protein DI589_08965 [Shinella sp.]|nr:MAG: hypothetical protein DI589_08965 [Shinella sp.]
MVTIRRVKAGGILWIRTKIPPGALWRRETAFQAANRPVIRWRIMVRSGRELKRFLRQKVPKNAFIRY